MTKRLNHHRCSVFLSSKKYLLGFCACLILHFYVLVLPITHYSFILNLLLSFEKVNIHLSLALLTLSPFIGLLLPFISLPFSNFVSIPKSYQEVILVPAYNRLWMEKMQALVSWEAWDLVHAPHDISVGGNRWIYIAKFHSNGFVYRFRAHLIVKGSLRLIKFITLRLSLLLLVSTLFAYYSLLL